MTPPAPIAPAPVRIAHAMTLAVADARATAARSASEDSNHTHPDLPHPGHTERASERARLPALRADARYWMRARIDHDPPECALCWAGMMMLARCDADPGKSHTPHDFGPTWSGALHALEAVRRGDWEMAARWMHGPKPRIDETSNEASTRDPKGMRRAMAFNQAMLRRNPKIRDFEDAAFSDWDELARFLDDVQSRGIPTITAVENEIYPIAHT